MPDHPSVPLDGYREYPPEEMLRRATEFADDIHRRRTVRTFSDRAVDPEVVRECIRAAGAAPSGANLQPWRFVVVTDPEIKRRIRVAAEAEEEAFYSGRAPDEWLEALAHLGTDAEKPFLERAPVLIAVFGESYGLSPEGEKRKNYYVTESVGLATGFLIAALHRAGLATLTHTPSPMGFLNEVLGRGRNERAFVLLVVGYPESGTMVPDIARKPVEEIMAWVGPESGQGEGR